MNCRIVIARTALRIAIGLMAALAGLDTFFNLLADDIRMFQMRPMGTAG